MTATTAKNPSPDKAAPPVVKSPTYAGCQNDCACRRNKTNCACYQGGRGIKPPAAHTHRGTPRSWVLEGHHEATKPKRTPTHRKPGPARVPAQFAHLATIREHLNG